MLPRLLFDRIVAENHTAIARFSKKGCLRSRFNGNECRACLEECKTRALTLSGKVVAFDQQKCTGCMRCVSVCPNDAFDGGVDVVNLLDTLRNSNKDVAIACKKNAHIQLALVVPCIGFLSEFLLAAMNSVAQKNIIIKLSYCSDCNNNHFLSSFYEKIQNLTNKLSRNGRLPLKCIIEKNTSHPDDKKSSRRSYLHFGKKTLIKFGKEAARSGQPKIDLSSSHVGKKPVMNSAALQYAYNNSSQNDKIILSSYFYTVRATEQCNLCPGCQGMCPTGALKRTDVNGEKRLLFTSSACSGCGLCREFCKKGALEVVKGFVGNPEQPLHIY